MNHTDVKMPGGSIGDVSAVLRALWVAWESSNPRMYFFTNFSLNSLNRAVISPNDFFCRIPNEKLSDYLPRAQKKNYRKILAGVFFCNYFEEAR